MKEQIKPGMFGKTVVADNFRTLFDFLNEQILMSDKRPQIVFLGDSITQHWDTNLFFGDLGYIVNRGIGGDVTEYMLKRSDADVFQLSPEKLVFLGGINDLITTCPDLWWGVPAVDRRQVGEAFKNNIEALMQKARENEVKAYFCSIIPTKFCAPYSTFGMEENVLQFNEIIKTLCVEYGHTYVDYYSALCDESGLYIKDGITYDGVHPKFAGYQIMAKVLREKLNENL